MINEILQWIAIALILFLLAAPKVRQIVEDFKEEESE